jgi:hypothetical protein
MKKHGNEEFKVGERVESDHMPLEVRTKGREKERSMKDVKKKKNCEGYLDGRRKRKV